MSAGFDSTVADTLRTLAGQPGAVLSETLAVCRVDGASCIDARALADLAAAAKFVADHGYGGLDVFGTITGQFDPAVIPFDQIGGETLQIVLRKERRDGWCYFVTVKGFGTALNDGLVAEPLTIWVSETFEPFSALTLTVSPWDGPTTPPVVDRLPELPRKLVRDQSHGRAPSAIGAWLLVARPAKPSPVFSAWSRAAVERLAFVLPYEIRVVDGRDTVVLKGPRSKPVEVSAPVAGRHEELLGPLTEAVNWVYTSGRDAEPRFLFLNNHLSLDWRDGQTWPEGALLVLKESLSSAREAYAFHLQDQSKDALKSLGDLRKTLQEEVAKAQSATRDLLSALWRDLAIAGVVLALKSPTAQQVTGSEALRAIPFATAVLLVLSLLVTVLANWRFNWLADKGRRDWRRKLYAFVPEEDWKMVVEKPISQGRRIYQMTLPFVGAMYATAAWYLISLADPTVLAGIWTFLLKLFDG